MFNIIYRDIEFYVVAAEKNGDKYYLYSQLDNSNTELFKMILPEISQNENGYKYNYEGMRGILPLDINTDTGIGRFMVDSWEDDDNKKIFEENEERRIAAEKHRHPVQESGEQTNDQN